MGVVNKSMFKVQQNMASGLQDRISQLENRNHKGPKGEKGHTGEDGVKGVKGESGLSGIKGNLCITVNYTASLIKCERSK